MSRLHTLFLSLLVCAMISFSPAGLAKVDYQLTVDRAEHHTATVTARFEQVSGEYFDVSLPAWRTGKYQILNFANTVRNFEASSKKSPLRWEKIEKSTWRIHTEGRELASLTVKYQLYANQLGTRSRHIDSSHAYINASAYFMYNEGKRAEPVSVRLKVPKGWKSYSGMDSGRYRHSFTAPNYDILADSPIETGISQHFEFEEGGRDYELVIWGKGNYDAEKMRDDLKKLVATWPAIWDSVPYERYVFMVHATNNARGATEHKNSTVIQRKRWTFAERDDYIEFLGTASHEFIHTWNVKLYRPDNIAYYDYINPNYTRLLWLAEGSTSYFDDQLLLRAGLITPAEYFKILAKIIERNESTPGRDMQSVAASSFDNWIHKRGDFAVNNSVSIYSEGLIASWVLDHELLQRSQLQVSYRDVHRQLARDYALPKAFTEADVKNILATLSGSDFSNWWQQHIDRPFRADFDTLLNSAGLRRDYGNTAKQGFTGITVDRHKGLARVTQVERSTPGWDSGLTSDDLIVAIDGVRTDGGDFAKRTQAIAPGQKILVAFFRNDELQETTLQVGEKPKTKLKVVPVDNPSDAQKAFFKAWLGVELPSS